MGITYNFQGWYRSLQWDTAVKTIIISELDVENGTATVKVNSQISGILNVGASQSGAWLDATRKPFTHNITRQAIFQKTDEGWKVQKITPSYHSSFPVDSTRSIDIKSVKIYNTSVTPEKLIINITDINTLYDRKTLPKLSANSTIKVEMEVLGNTENNTNYCFLHHHIWIRHAMFDDGSSAGDQISGDNIYTRTYNVGAHTGIFLVFFDILSRPPAIVTGQLCPIIIFSAIPTYFNIE